MPYLRAKLENSNAIQAPTKLEIGKRELGQFFTPPQFAESIAQTCGRW
jgi:hypothetical protein